MERKSCFREIILMALTAMLVFVATSCKEEVKGLSDSPVINSDAKNQYCELVHVDGATIANEPEVTNGLEEGVVIDPYYIGRYEVTYDLWKTVYDWATNTKRKENIYTFDNKGTEGAHGQEGAKPTEGAFLPVSSISYNDTVVWCNAYSEMKGREPVYTFNGAIIRSTKAENGAVCQNAVPDYTKNGFRLPTNAEWEYAARGADQNGEGWNYLYSGIEEEYKEYSCMERSDSLNEVAWCVDNTIKPTFIKLLSMSDVDEFMEQGDMHKVGTKKANQIGLFDMTGNAYEFVFDTDGTNEPIERYRRGGAWYVYEGGIDSYFSRLKEKIMYNLYTRYPVYKVNRVDVSYFDSTNGFRLAVSAKKAEAAK